MKTSGSPSIGRGAFALGVLGVAAFTLYGSLVPFHFHARSWSEVTEAFGWVLSHRVRVESRSDGIANVLLGVPLGFLLLGWRCVDREWTRRKMIGVGLLLLPVCALFAAVVEFAQLYFPTRTCAASDILAQTLGALFGMTAWVLFGQKFTERARAVWAGTDKNPAARLLIAYLVLLAFIQALPLDVSASPYQLYRRFRDAEVRLVPFRAFDGLTDTEGWKQIAKLLTLAGLFFPVGLLAARLKGRFESWSTIRVALAAVAVAFCLEAIQLVVKSRTPSTTDVLVGALAALAGLYAGRIHSDGVALPLVVCWAVVWLACMTPITQSAPGTARLESPRPFDWIPGLPLESANPLFALEEMLTKLVLFGLLGVLSAAWYFPRASRARKQSDPVPKRAVLIASVLGLVASAFFENSQRWFEIHTPCITDVLLGGLGAALGSWLAGRK
ncbi:MAG: VanZ family protein [Planctomycetia bacterium]|nr:VanZ family protein [Planctomycetia bacterium]